MKQVFDPFDPFVGVKQVFETSIWPLRWQSQRSDFSCSWPPGLHTSQKGFRHSRILMCFFFSHSFVALAVCFESLSCWNTHPWPIFNALALTVHGPVHRPFDAVQLFCPLSITPPKYNVSTSMFDNGDGVFGVIGSILPPNTASWGQRS